MDCYYCLGKDTVEEKMIRYFMGAGSNPYFIDNLPVKVCRSCGPTRFSSVASMALDKIRNGKATPIGAQIVSVFDFNNPRDKPEKVSASPSLSKAAGE
jgi:YgiT-type zinc finger domain-containing protein